MTAHLELWLVRHGETEPNLQRRYPRHDEDAPLSALGEQQARRLKEVLPAHAVTSTSPATRARQTAAWAGFPAARPTSALREADFGVMAGHTWAELQERFGEAPWSWIEGLWDPAADLGPPGGETGQGFHARVKGWLDGLLTQDPRRPVVAFTHAGPVRAALQLTLGLRAVEVRPGCSAVLRWQEGWVLAGLNWPQP